MKVTVNSDLIQRRQSALMSTIESADSRLYYERAKIAEQDQKPNATTSIQTFVENCCDKRNANKYYRQCMYFLEKANEKENTWLANYILSTFTEGVLPYIQDVEVVIPCLERFELTKEQTQTITEAAEQYRIADRVLTNHNIISKRFHIDSMFDNVPHRKINLENTIYECCKMIDTYDVKPAEKMNLALEEVVYQLQKNCIPYDGKAIKTITEYFLHRESEIQETDYLGYRSVLENCPLLRESDCDQISYFVKFYDIKSNPVLQAVHKFSSNPVKNAQSLVDMIQGIFALCKPNDIASGMRELLSYIKRYLVTESEIIPLHDTLTAISLIPSLVKAKALEDRTFDRRNVTDIIIAFEDEIKEIDVMGYDMDDLPDFMDRWYDLKDVYVECIKVLRDTLDILYTSDNMVRMEAVYRSNEQPLTLQEFKLLKFDNIINTCMKIDKMLREKSKKITKKVGGKLRKIKSFLFEQVDLLECIDSSNHFDLCIAKYEILEGIDYSELHEAAEELCAELNYNRPEQCQVYYEITDGLEIHVGCQIPIQLTEEERIQVEQSVSMEDLLRAASLSESVELLDMFGSTVNLVETVKERIPDLSLEQYRLMMEASSFVSVFDTKTIQQFTTLFNDTHEEVNALEKARLCKMTENWMQEEAPDSIMVEASLLTCAILESEDEKNKINKDKKEKEDALKKKPSIVDRIKNKIPNNEKDEKKEEKEPKKDKNPFAGVNLNSLKLYVSGLRAKIKDLSSKEKELSRNLDTSVERLRKSMESALVSDRREAIIKGSVIPSFSKAIKMAIAVAGIGVINPPLAIITVFAGFIMSKKLTKKERLLMLDELETEMEVIDKEIELAQSRNQIKRYRTLLRYKKECQREYQRIRYNIKIGQDILPGSSAGIKNND